MPYLFPEEEPTVMEQCSYCKVYFPEDEAYGTSEKPLCPSPTCLCDHDWSGWPGAYCFKCGAEAPEYDEDNYDPMMDADPIPSVTD